MVDRSCALVSEIARDFGVDGLLSLGSYILVLYWFYHHAFPVKWQTLAFACVMYGVSAAGVAVGGIRYWTQRDFAASSPLQCLLIFMFACAGQSSVVEFVRTHRPRSSSQSLQHHSTDEDEVDVSDLTQDHLLMFYERALSQSDHITRYVLPINVLCCFVMPACVSAWAWAEAWACAAAWQAARYLAALYLPGGLWGPSPLVSQI